MSVHQGYGPPPLPPVKPGLSRGVKIALWIIGVPAVLIAALILWFVAMLSGGFDDLFNRPGPFETDPQVVQAREQGHQKNRPALDGIVSGPAQSVLGERRVLARATTNACEEGFHDWKRDDPYDLSCNLSDAVVIEGDLATFREDMLALHEAIQAEKTYRENSGSVDLSRAMLEYWDNRATFTENFPEYSPNDLPGARYETSTYDTRLHFEWIDSTDRNPGALPSTFGDATWTTPNGQPLDPQSLPTLFGPGIYGLIIEVERNYFEE